MFVMPQKYYLVYSEEAPNGIVCREIDLKKWMLDSDKTARATEVDAESVPLLQAMLEEQDEELGKDTRIELPKGLVG